MRLVRDRFWRTGFSGTSLDDLSEATGLKRPSLYGAFGDKRRMFLEALGLYREAARDTLTEALGFDELLREALLRTYRKGLRTYLAGAKGRQGCFVIGNAPVEAIGDEDVAAALAGTISDNDAAFAERFRRAAKAGELPADADATGRATLATALLHSLSLRARAGHSQTEIEAVMLAGVELLCRS